MRHYLSICLLLIALATVGRADTPATPDNRGATLVAAMNDLDRWLATDANQANAQRWRKYLLFSELRVEVAKGPAGNRRTLEAIAAKYQTPTPGLEHPRFVAVGAALSAWLNPSAATTKLTAAALEQQYGYANFFAEMSAPVVGAGVNQHIDERMPITDYILGTSIHGTTHTIGDVTMQLVPNSHYASMRTVLAGTAYSDTVGYHRPVTIYSTGTTTISGTKATWLDNNGIHGCISCAHAETHTCINGICANTRRMQGMIEKMAWKRAGKSKSQAEAIASDHAEARIVQRIESQAAPMIANGNKSFREKLKDPLVKYGAQPKYVNFSTTTEAMYVTALQAAEGQMGAPDAPPALPAPEAMNARVHESAVNNLMFKRYGGQTITNESVKQDLINLYGKVPEEFQEPADPDLDNKDEPKVERTWTMSFDAQQPIVVTFAANGFKVLIRGSGFTRDEKSYPAMDIRAEYKLEPVANGGFLAKRQGNLLILPPDFEARPVKQMRAVETAIAGILRKRFDKILKPELVSDGVELPNQWKKAGKLPWAFAQSDSGWFAASWKMGLPPTTAAE